MTKYSYRELQKCAEREVAMRINVFRKRGMNDRAADEIAKMRAIAEYFEAMANDAEQFEAMARDERAGANPDGMMFVEGQKEGSSHAAPLYERKAEE